MAFSKSFSSTPMMIFSSDEPWSIIRMLMPAFAIAVFDVNDLKDINDREGHEQGDIVIVEACRMICEVFRNSQVYFIEYLIRVAVVFKRAVMRYTSVVRDAGGDLETRRNRLVRFQADNRVQITPYAFDISLFQIIPDMP